VSGWGGHLDDLADATAQLLANGSVHVEPLVNAQAALAARDAVVTELRTLIGAVISAPPTVEVGELTMSDITHRPALALHRALSELPRAVEFATGPAVGELVDAALPDYERAWQAARRATVGLEGYVNRLGRLDEVHGWDVLRDLTDLAAAVPYLDRDLSEAILPQLKAGEDLALPYRLQTAEGHDAVRIVAAEIRARVPAAAPSSSPVAGWSHAGELVTAAAGQPAADLSEDMVRYTYSVSARNSLVSMPEVKAAARLLQDGSRHAASVLERVAPAVAGAGEAAQLLRAVAGDASRLLDAPGRSMSPPRTDLIGAGNDLLDRVSMLAEIADRLPGGAAAQDLRRLAAPAVAFAQQVPALAGALDLSVREAIGTRVMLIPADERRVAWVTASMVDQKRRGEPSQIATATGQLSMTTRRIAPAVRTAAADLARDERAKPDPRQTALITARRHVGAARDDLRTALNNRTVAQAAPLSAAWPAHPRDALPPQRSGPKR